MTAFTGTFTVTSTYGGYSGHTSGGLRDGSCTGATSVWGSNSGTLEWIKADLGSIVTIDDVGIGPINSSFDGWGPSYTDGRLLQISDDDSTWTTVHTLSGHANNTVKTYTVSASGRYVRILYSGGGNYLGVGDFQINYTASASFKAAWAKNINTVMGVISR